MMDAADGRHRPHGRVRAGESQQLRQLSDGARIARCVRHHSPSTSAHEAPDGSASRLRIIVDASAPFPGTDPSAVLASVNATRPRGECIVTSR